ncbi:cytochrome c [Oleiagrimonas sp. C23AA]|uniref:c-type cytochrome n=1 Tax=Oleiagrimonas sp. C23AA TaxID=2719047 RepID=UPI00141ED73F|nr:cytochrome c [Oleiagrimonas sp. C23AA]NII09925.1 cytochrome c [Oleiagrimonas sp. C23AA]
MRRHLLVLGFVAATGFAVSAAALAASQSTRAIEYRQGIYHAIGWNFHPMLDMVRGKQAWNQAEFSKRAKRIAFYSQQLLEGFPAGSDKGAKTDAKPGIWSHFDDFKQKMSDFETTSAHMAQVAERGDEAASKKAFMDTAKACKACHERYREK